MAGRSAEAGGYKDLAALLRKVEPVVGCDSRHVLLAKAFRLAYLDGLV